MEVTERSWIMSYFFGKQEHLVGVVLASQEINYYYLAFAYVGLLDAMLNMLKSLFIRASDGTK